MGALELIQVINSLLPLVERALAEGREVSKEELAAALGATDAKIDALRDAVNQMP